MRQKPCRAGMTFAELMIATAVTGIIAATVSALAITVETATSYNRNADTATQNARVVLDRIQRTMRAANANELFPGILSISTTVGNYSYPDAVAVWTPPNGTPSNTANTGLPLYKELTIYCPSPTNPGSLLEITRPNDSTVAPTPSDTTSWAATINTFATASDSTVLTLTTMLRTASATGTVTIHGDGNGKGNTTTVSQMRGCVRFEILLRPSITELNAYRTLATSNQTYSSWETIPWPQNYYTRNSGTRQTWCRIELQLMPDPNWTTNDPAGVTAVPFFGSASLYYEIPR